MSRFSADFFETNYKSWKQIPESNSKILNGHFCYRLFVFLKTSPELSLDLSGRRHRNRLVVRLQRDASAAQQRPVAFAANLDPVAGVRGQAMGQAKRKLLFAQKAAMPR
jgi:hypothetical protein